METRRELPGTGRADGRPRHGDPVEGKPSKVPCPRARGRKKVGRQRRICFTIEGPLQGYRQTTKKSIYHPKERERSAAYGAWKTKVLYLAMEAGFPNQGTASSNRPPRLSVIVHWVKGPRIDWKNMYGAVEDALWYDDDRWVKPGRESDVIEDSGREMAEVIVRV